MPIIFPEQRYDDCWRRGFLQSSNQQSHNPPTRSVFQQATVSHFSSISTNTIKFQRSEHHVDSNSQRAMTNSAHMHDPAMELFPDITLKDKGHRYQKNHNRTRSRSRSPSRSYHNRDHGYARHA